MIEQQSVVRLRHGVFGAALDAWHFVLFACTVAAVSRQVRATLESSQPPAGELSRAGRC
jgi:hypothetical protein